MSVIDVSQSPYNAKGDGTTDDRVAIQDALDDAVAGDEVYIPATSSYYKIVKTGTQQNLLIQKGITVRGDGNTELRAANGGRLFTMAPAGEEETDMLDIRDGADAYSVDDPVAGSKTISFTTAGDYANFAVDDYVLLCNASGATSDTPFISQLGYVESVDSGNNAVDLVCPVAGEFDTSESYKLCKVGFSPLEGARVTGLKLKAFGGVTNTQLMINWCTNVVVDNVWADDGICQGVTALNSHAVVISSCRFTRLKNGIRLGGGLGHCSVYGNTFEDMSECGIHMDSPCGWIAITGNTMTGCQHPGIYLKRAYHSTVTGNVVSGCGMSQTKPMGMKFASVWRSAISSNIVVGGVKDKYTGICVYWENAGDPSWYESCYNLVTGNQVSGVGGTNSNDFLDQFPSTPASQVTNLTKTGNSFT